MARHHPTQRNSGDERGSTRRSAGGGASRPPASTATATGRRLTTAPDAAWPRARDGRAPGRGRHAPVGARRARRDDAGRAADRASGSTCGSCSSRPTAPSPATAAGRRRSSARACPTRSTSPTSTRRRSPTPTWPTTPTNHAKYSAVILASGDLGRAGRGTTLHVGLHDGRVGHAGQVRADLRHPPAQRRHVPRRRRTASRARPRSRRPDHAVAQRTAALTAAGKAVFPYLKGDVPIADAAPSATPATPVSATDFQPLALAGRPGGTILGIYTHPDDGREEMVMTVASNETQIHNQLLRHGMLSWVTRGVYLGYQRNYLELQVDDLFLGDDAWDSDTNVTSYDPAQASRMTPGRRRPGDRLVEGPRPAARLGLQRRRQRALPAGPPGRDERPAARRRQGAAGQARRSAGSTTRCEHPNLDCSTAPFITKQIADNVAFGDRERPPARLGDGARHRRALRPRQHACRATRARSTRRSSRGHRHHRGRRREPGGELRVGRHGRVAGR